MSWVSSSVRTQVDRKVASTCSLFINSALKSVGLIYLFGLGDGGPVDLVGVVAASVVHVAAARRLLDRHLCGGGWCGGEGGGVAAAARQRVLCRGVGRGLYAVKLWRGGEKDPLSKL